MSAFLSFAVGGLTGAFLLSQVSGKLEEYSAAFDARLCSRARRPAAVKNFNIEVGALQFHLVVE